MIQLKESLRLIATGMRKRIFNASALNGPCCPADIAANKIRNGSFALEGRNVLKQGGECFDRSIRVGVKHGG